MADAVCVTAGPNALLDTTPGGDDVIEPMVGITTGANGICETTAVGDDESAVLPNQGALDSICIEPGPDGILGSELTGPEPIPNNFGELALSVGLHNAVDLLTGDPNDPANGARACVVAAPGTFSPYLDPTEPKYQSGIYVELGAGNEPRRFLTYHHVVWPANWPPPPVGVRLGSGSAVGRPISAGGTFFHVHFSMKVGQGPYTYQNPLAYLPSSMYQYAVGMPEVRREARPAPRPILVHLKVARDPASCEGEQELERRDGRDGGPDWYRVRAEQLPLDLIAEVRSKSDPTSQGLPEGQATDTDYLLPYRVSVAISQVGGGYSAAWTAFRMDTINDTTCSQKSAMLFGKESHAYGRFRVVVTNCDRSGNLAELANVTDVTDAASGHGCWDPPRDGEGRVLEGEYEVQVVAADLNGNVSEPGVVRIQIDPDANDRPARQP